MTKVSVLIPTYNGRHTVVRAIESALVQDGVDVEVCVVDDASTDDTWDVLLMAYGTHPRVHLARLLENTRAVGALQRATDMATGDYLIRLDHDDWYAPGALAGLAAALDANPRSFAYGQVKYWGRLSHVFTPSQTPDFTSSNASLYAYMFPRRAVLEGCRWHQFGVGTGPGDWEFALQLIEHGYAPNPQPGIMVLHYVYQTNTQHETMQADMAAHMDELRRLHTGVRA